MTIDNGGSEVSAHVTEPIRHKFLSLMQLEVFFERYFWLFPLIGFSLGWASFVLIHRGEALARGVAFLALLGWPWILAEPYIVPYFMGKRNPKLVAIVTNFFNQTIQQEIFFFTLPFLIAATHIDDIGQMAFTIFIIIAAVVSTIDPIYAKYVHRHRLANLAFHVLCCFIAALVILPLVVKLPTNEALLFALAFVVVWLVLMLPGLLRNLAGWKPRLITVLVVCMIPLCIWMIRSSIPATAILVTHAEITTRIIDHEPADAITTLTVAELDTGVYAFAAIRAPNGLTQRIIFRWSHENWKEDIPALIEGGRDAGFRTYSMKNKFIAESTGLWKVDILTSEEQLLSRLSFTVTQ